MTGWLLGFGIPVVYVLLGSIVGTRCAVSLFRGVHSYYCAISEAEMRGRELPEERCTCDIRIGYAVPAGLLWPLSVVILLGWYIAKPRAQISRSERKLKALNADIAERERQLGIGTYR